MFQVVVDLRRYGEHVLFTHALREFYMLVVDQTAIVAKCKKLEACDFIVYHTAISVGVMNFYQVKKFAEDLYLLGHDGVLLSHAVEPSMADISFAFAVATGEISPLLSETIRMHVPEIGARLALSA